jgi:hypothetical protein
VVKITLSGKKLQKKSKKKAFFEQFSSKINLKKLRFLKENTYLCELF